MTINTNTKTKLSDLNYFVYKDQKANKGKLVCCAITKIEASSLKNDDKYKGGGYLFNGEDLKEFCASKAAKCIAKNKIKFTLIIKAAAMVAVVALCILGFAFFPGGIVAGLLIGEIASSLGGYLGILFLAMALGDLVGSGLIAGGIILKDRLEDVVKRAESKKEDEIKAVLNSIIALEEGDKTKEEKAVALLEIVKLSSKEINLMIKKKEADAVAKARADVIMTKEQIKQRIQQLYNLNTIPFPKFPELNLQQQVV